MRPLAPPLSTWTRFPWQLIFVLLGTLGLFVALLLLIIREPTRRARDVFQRNGIHEASLRELFARRKRLLLCLIVGPGVMSIAFYSLFAWGPTMVERKFGWGPNQVALWFTPLGITSGLLGPWIGAATGMFLVKSGRPDGLPRASVYLACSAVVSCVAAMTVREDVLSVALLFISMGLLTGVATLPTIAIQYIMPNELRGQVTALFVFCSNILGFGLGPTLVALLTDHVFRNSASLNFSLAVVCTVALACGGSITVVQLPSYRKYLAESPRARI
jgi:MFS family permease